MDTVQSGVPNVPSRSFISRYNSNVEFIPSSSPSFQVFFIYLFLVFLFISPGKVRGAAYDMVLS
jgi:hypothetical protein